MVVSRSEGLLWLNASDFLLRFYRQCLFIKYPVSPKINIGGSAAPSEFVANLKIDNRNSAIGNLLGCVSRQPGRTYKLTPIV